MIHYCVTPALVEVSLYKIRASATYAYQRMYIHQMRKFDCINPNWTRWVRVKYRPHYWGIRDCFKEACGHLALLGIRASYHNSDEYLSRVCDDWYRHFFYRDRDIGIDMSLVHHLDGRHLERFTLV